MKPYINVFKNEAQLNEMIRLRREGWTYKSLATIYGVDHTSIYFWCKKMSIPRPVITISLDISEILDKMGIKVRRHKSYADYLKEQQDRKFPNLYRLKHTVY